MHDYKVYCLDQQGKISSANRIQAETLEAAIAQVRDTHPGNPCEIWDGPKCLAKVPA